MLERLRNGMFGYYAKDPKDGWYCQICNDKGIEVGVTECYPNRKSAKAAASLLAVKLSREGHLAKVR